jgi:putative flavoprotein involved in K+ transport
MSSMPGDEVRVGADGGRRRVETLVIGGSQAGLAVGYHLRRLGRPFLIVDGHERVGGAWRERWDSLRLFTPARYDGLPGMPFPGPRWSYPGKDEVADYLETYARTFDLPVRTGVMIERLTRRGGLFEASSGEGVYLAENVVVATGPYRTPRVPAFADALDPGIVQLHSSRYSNPENVPPGDVLVVGAGNSGAEIALELSTRHRTWLSGRPTGQEPTRAGSLPDRLVTPLVWFIATRVLTVGSPIGRRARDHFLHPPRGIPLGRVRNRDLTAAGVERVPRVDGVRDGRPLLQDGRSLDVAAVVWCTGFDIDLSWIDLPLVQSDGYPEQDRGVFPNEPGLYILGLPFLRSLSSLLLGGVGADAAHIADHIVIRMHGSTSDEQLV